jgi:hypothetical protein
LIALDDRARAVTDDAAASAVADEDRRLILRPLSADYPVQLIALADNETPADYLVGRVCLVSSEL